MRRAARTDTNQAEIVRMLSQFGASVVSLAAVGSGVPDLLVGYQGRNFLLEVKDGNKPPSRRRLTSDQVEFHRDWRGSVSVVKNADEALQAVGIKTVEVA